MATLTDSIPTNGYSTGVRKTIEQPASFVQANASTQVFAGKGIIKGILVSSTTSGTLKIWDSLSATGTVLINTITPAAGTFIPLPNVQCNTGCYVTAANTIEYTILYSQ